MPISAFFIPTKAKNKCLCLDILFYFMKDQDNCSLPSAEQEQQPKEMCNTKECFQKQNQKLRVSSVNIGDKAQLPKKR